MNETEQKVITDIKNEISVIKKDTTNFITFLYQWGHANPQKAIAIIAFIVGFIIGTLI
jgi:ElaB/YqjD/DUF883 family membrane-anchored ribosome-binding protein